MEDHIKGSLEVIDLGKKVFLCKFTQSCDYNEPYLEDHGLFYLMISTWKPNLKLSINSFDHMSIWIRIDELPI